VRFVGPGTANLMSVNQRRGGAVPVPWGGNNGGRLGARGRDDVLDERDVFDRILYIW